MTPSLGGSSLIVKKRTDKKDNILNRKKIEYCFHNVRKCTVYRVNKSQKYNMTRQSQLCLEFKCISTLFFEVKSLMSHLVFTNPTRPFSYRKLLFNIINITLFIPCGTNSPWA